MSVESKNLLAVLKEEVHMGRTPESLSAAFEKTDSLKAFKAIVENNGARILDFDESQAALNQYFKEAANDKNIGFIGRLIMKGMQKFQERVLKMDGIEDFEWKSDVIGLSVPLDSVEQIKAELKALDFVEKVGQPNFAP